MIRKKNIKIWTTWDFHIVKISKTNIPTNKIGTKFDHFFLQFKEGTCKFVNFFVKVGQINIKNFIHSTSHDQ